MTGFDVYDNSGIFADALSVWNSRVTKGVNADGN